MYERKIPADSKAREGRRSVLSRSVCTPSGQAGAAELLHGHCHWGFFGEGAEGLGQVWAHQIPPGLCTRLTKQN